MKAIVFALLASAVGCEDAKDYKLRDFANEYLPAYCAWGVRCGLSENQRSCVDNLPLDIGGIEAAINSGRVVFDEQEANKCLVAFKTLPCNGYNDLTLSCFKVIVPQISKGGVCMNKDECKSNDCETAAPACDQTTTCCTGKCVGDDLRRNLPNDATCSRSVECTSGVCTAEGSSGESVKKCIATPSINEPCTVFCKAGLECRPQGATKESLCKPYPKTGESCSLFCASLSDYCMRDGTCGPRVAAGKPCGQGDSCVSWAECTNGVCVKSSTLGETCVVSGTNDTIGNCLYSLRCVNGKCATRPSSPVCL